MARSFEDYRGGAATRGCPRCGGPQKEGAVTIRLLEFADGNSSRYNQKASRQVSLCEGCAVEVYEELVDKLNAEANGGSRAPRSQPARASAATTTRRRRRAKAGAR